MKILVIILNYNSSADCKRCVEQIRNQKKLACDIVIVDNCSKENECHEVEEFCLHNDCVFLQSLENRGYSAGNNIGLRYASEHHYHYAAICNPDMEFPQDDCLARCLQKMCEDEDIVVLAPDIVMPDGITHQNPQQDSDDQFLPILLGPWYLFKGLLLRNLPKSYAEVNWQQSRYCRKVVGCFFMVRVSFIQAIGFLDENTFLYCEEPILARQVRNNKKKMYYLAEAKALHNHVKSEKGNPCRNMKIFQKSQLYFYKNYCGFSKTQYALIYLTRIVGNFFWNLLLAIKYRNKQH